jgi:hypothetical protein
VFDKRPNIHNPVISRLYLNSVVMSEDQVFFNCGIVKRPCTMLLMAPEF